MTKKTKEQENEEVEYGFEVALSARKRRLFNKLMKELEKEGKL